MTVVMKPGQTDFPVPWDGRGWFGTEFWVKSISCNDWDDRFLLVLESEDAERYQAFYVMADEVYDLLENCLRIPEQTNENENPNLFI